MVIMQQKLDSDPKGCHHVTIVIDTLPILQLELLAATSDSGARAADQ